MSATVSGQFVSSTSNLAGKTYLAVLQASTSAMTQQKRLASATFTVNVPLATLKGLMSAGSKPVCLGKDEVLSYSVTNAGTTDISNANVAVLVIDPDTKEVKKVFRTIVNVLANATISGSFTFATAQIAPKAYIADL